jgi:putative FmdB family regulatory protein
MALSSTKESVAKTNYISEDLERKIQEAKGVKMPVYDYKCKMCDEEIEVLHKSLGKCYRVICPRCDTKRMPSSANIKFIGNGWSKDGYSKEKK